MKIRKKVLLSMSAVFMLFGVATGAALLGMQGAKNRFEHFLQTEQALLQAASGMYADGLQSGQALRNIVIEPLNATGHKNLEKANSDFQDNASKALALTGPNTADRKLIENVRALREQQLAIQRRIVGLAATDQPSAISAISQEETPIWRTVRGHLLEFIKSKNAEVERAKAELGQFTERMLLTAGALTVAGDAVRSRDPPVAGERSDQAARRRTGIREKGRAPVAAGDLTSDVVLAAGDHDSMLAGMRQMVQNLRQLLGEISSGAHTVSDTSAQIAQGNLDLSQRTEEQASTLEETASSMEELTTHGDAERAERAPGQPAGGGRLGGGAQGRAGGGAGGEHDERDLGVVAQDRRHHRGDRRDRVPDQHPGAQCGGGSGARGRAGPRLCGGGRGGEEPGAAQRRGGQGDQDADRRLGGQGGGGHQAGGRGGPDDGGDREVGQEGERPDCRDCGGQPGAELGDRAGEHGGDADGPGGAAKRLAGGGGDGGHRVDEGAGRCAAAGGGALQAGRRRGRGRRVAGCNAAPGSGAEGAARADQGEDRAGQAHVRLRGLDAPAKTTGNGE